MHWTRLTAPIVLVIAVTCRSAEAQAAEPDAAAAKAAAEAFAEGRRLMDQAQQAEACKKFERSEQLAPSGRAVYALGECYEATGKIASARVAYGKAAARAVEANREDIAKYAREKSDALAVLVPTINVRVPKADVVVEQDGERMPASALNVEIEVDPGPHDFKATRDGHVFTTQITTGRGEKGVFVVIPGLEDAGTRAGTSPATSDGGESPSRPPLRVVSYALVGAGIVAVAGGAIFGLLASGNASDVDAACPHHTCASEEVRRTTNDANDRASTQATLSTALFIGGGVAAASGVGIYLLTRPKAVATLRVGAGSLSVAGHF